MNRILEVKPIYKGNYNMTPGQYDKIVHSYKKHKRSVLRIMNALCWILTLVCCSYLTYAIVR